MMTLNHLAINEYQLFGDGELEDVVLARRQQMDGSSKWAVIERSFCLNKDGEWEYEPRPSSRDDEYLQRTRFNSAEEAYNFWLTVEHKSSVAYHRAMR